MGAESETHGPENPAGDGDDSVSRLHGNFVNGLYTKRRYSLSDIRGGRKTTQESGGGTPEERARRKIDELLKAAGWAVQDRDEFDPRASRGVAVRELPLDTGSADYLLFVDRRAVGVIEAKPEGTTLGGVSDQSQKYLDGIPARLLQGRPAPFAYESTGTETHFRDVRDPHPRSRRVFSFHRPETLATWFAKEDTLRTKLGDMPPLAPRRPSSPDERENRRRAGPDTVRRDSGRLLSAPTIPQMLLSAPSAVAHLLIVLLISHYPINLGE